MTRDPRRARRPHLRIGKDLHAVVVAIRDERVPVRQAELSRIVEQAVRPSVAERASEQAAVLVEQHDRLRVTVDHEEPARLVDRDVRRKTHLARRTRRELPEGIRAVFRGPERSGYGVDHVHGTLGCDGDVHELAFAGKGHLAPDAARAVEDEDSFPVEDVQLPRDELERLRRDARDLLELDESAPRIEHGDPRRLAVEHQHVSRRIELDQGRARHFGELDLGPALEPAVIPGEEKKSTVRRVRNDDPSVLGASDPLRALERLAGAVRVDRFLVHESGGARARGAKHPAPAGNDEDDGGADRHERSPFRAVTVDAEMLELRDLEQVSISGVVRPVTARAFELQVRVSRVAGTADDVLVALGRVARPAELVGTARHEQERNVRCVRVVALRAQAVAQRAMLQGRPPLPLDRVRMTPRAACRNGFGEEPAVLRAVRRVAGQARSFRYRPMETAASERLCQHRLVAIAAQVGAGFLDGEGRSGGGGLVAGGAVSFRNRLVDVSAQERLSRRAMWIVAARATRAGDFVSRVPARESRAARLVAPHAKGRHLGLEERGARHRSMCLVAGVAGEVVAGRHVRERGGNPLVAPGAKRVAVAAEPGLEPRPVRVVTVAAAALRSWPMDALRVRRNDFAMARRALVLPRAGMRVVAGRARRAHKGGVDERGAHLSADVAVTTQADLRLRAFPELLGVVRCRIANLRIVAAIAPALRERTVQRRLEERPILRSVSRVAAHAVPPPRIRDEMDFRETDTRAVVTLLAPVVRGLWE